MATLVMPLRADVPAYTFQLSLEGRLYNWVIRFNERMSRWIMDISDENNTPLVLGTPIQVDFNLIKRFKQSALPPGDFFAVDESGEGKQPDRQDLGNDIKLFYIEAS